MRVLTLAPIFGGGIPLVEDVVDSLRALQVEHRSLNQPEWVLSYKEATKTGDLLSFFAKIHEALDEALDTFTPELVLTFALAPIPPGFGAKLKNRKIRSVHWFVEDGKRFPIYERMLAEHDVLFAIQPALAASLQSKGHASVSYLPLGVPPRCRATSLKPAASPSHPIAFVGTPSARRQELFAPLVDQGLKLWGPGWKELGPPFSHAVQEDGRWLSREEELRTYCNAELVVNLHQDAGFRGEPDFINPRTFVLAALGIPQLLEDRLELAPLFDLTNELNVFKPTADLKSLSAELLESPEKLRRKADKARQRALENHLLEHRLTQILDKL